jgi:phage N-6-adenine-methyltransferase
VVQERVETPDNVAVIAIEDIRTDGGTQPRIHQDWKIIGEYAQDMLEGAIFPPVIIYFDDTDYWLADGFHRYHATRQINRETIAAEVRQGTQRDAILFSVGVNAHHGFRRANADKRAVVEKLLRDEEWSQWGNRKIARQCGVSLDLVNTMRHELSERNVQMTRKVERNGQEYTIIASNIGHSQPQEPISLADIFDPVGHSIPPSLLPPVRNVDNIPISVPHISSKNNEWYTPLKYIIAAHELMGGIDLDPASCELANEIVRAVAYYDISTNGLDKDWPKRVWLNPPYGYTDGRSNQDIWSSRLIDQFKNKITTEAVLLVNAAVDTAWFHRLLYEYPVCLTLGRINFTTPEPVANGSTHGSAFVYFGPKEKRFVEIFRQFGEVVRRWEE